MQAFATKNGKKFNCTIEKIHQNKMGQTIYTITPAKGEYWTLNELEGDTLQIKNLGTHENVKKLEGN